MINAESTPSRIAGERKCEQEMVRKRALSRDYLVVVTDAGGFIGGHLVEILQLFQMKQVAPLLYVAVPQRALPAL